MKCKAICTTTGKRCNNIATLNGYCISHFNKQECTLTEYQKEIYLLNQEGNTKKLIAECLDKSMTAIDKQIQTIMNKGYEIKDWRYKE